MKITPEIEAQILRLHHAERWPPGTIAMQLGIHHSSVRRVLERDGTPRATLERSSKLDPFIPFLVATLKKYPRLTAARLHQMVRERGFDGQQSHFRAVVARYRPAPPTEAYAYQGVLRGHTARFVTASELLNDLAAQNTGSALTRKLRQYSHWKIIVIDEVGYLAGSARHGDLLFEVINRRYQEKPVIITTNKVFTEWGEVFPSSTCVVTMVDRLIHKAEVVKIEAESYRLKEAKEREASKRAKRAEKKKSSKRKKGGCEE